jgi:hypothetical protein
VPIFVGNFCVAAVHFYRDPSADSAWRLVVAFGMLALLGVVRLQAVMVQDRIIRLEERLRLQALAPEFAGQLDRLSRRQVAALRFAGDEELPALARRVFAGEFATNGDIKRAVTHWRPDHMRV